MVVNEGVSFWKLGEEEEGVMQMHLHPCRPPWHVLPVEFGDAFRRRDHSLDLALRVWWHDPGTILFATPQKMVDRHLVDEILMLDAKNDNITLDLDTDTHLPVRISFTWLPSLLVVPGLGLAVGLVLGLVLARLGWRLVRLERS